MLKKDMVTLSNPQIEQLEEMNMFTTGTDSNKDTPKQQIIPTLENLRNATFVQRRSIVGHKELFRQGMELKMKKMKKQLKHMTGRKTIHVGSYYNRLHPSLLSFSSGTNFVENLKNHCNGATSTRSTMVDDYSETQVGTEKVKFKDKFEQLIKEEAHEGSSSSEEEKRAPDINYEGCQFFPFGYEDKKRMKGLAQNSTKLDDAGLKR